MKKIEALLSDGDGTLLNTHQSILKSFEFTFQEFGLPKPTQEDLNKVAGLPLSRCFRVLIPKRKDIDLLCDTFRTYQKKHPELVGLYPNTKKALRWSRDEKLSIALVTTRGRESTYNILDQTGITDMFDVIVTKNDTHFQKPHPQPIRHALRQLGVDSEQSIMYGDTVIDIRAGKRAGCRWTIATIHGSGGHGVIVAEPDIVIDDNIELITVLKVLQHRPMKLTKMLN